MNAEIKKVAVVAKRVSPEALLAASEVAHWLIRRGIDVEIDGRMRREAWRLTYV